VVESDTSQRLSLVLAVDVSTNATSLAQMQSALLSFVGGLGPDDQVALLAYYDQVEVMADFTNDPAELGDAIRGLAAGGNGTAVIQEVDQAVNMRRDLPAGRKAVLTFTNSGDTLNNLSPEGTLDNAQAAGVRIYPFGFGPNINEELLNNWARFSDG